jgi:MarR family transcriptional regulator, organic hydroperoxide resistance regulator
MLVSNPLRLDEQLCFALYAASRAITGAYQPLLAKLGLTHPQYLVLLVLWEHGPATVSALGARLHLDSGTLTPLLKRLEKQGVLTRTRTREDERVVEVLLTDAGLRLRERCVGLPLAVGCKTNLTRKQLGPLRETLKGLTDSLHAAQKEGSP